MKPHLFSCNSFTRLKNDLYWLILSLHTTHADGKTWHEATAVSLKLTDSSRGEARAIRRGIRWLSGPFFSLPSGNAVRVTTKLSLAHCGLIKIASLALTIGRSICLLSGLSSTLPKSMRSELPSKVLLAQCEWTVRWITRSAYRICVTRRSADGTVCVSTVNFPAKIQTFIAALWFSIER
jgi:hypothetical protein